MVKVRLQRGGRKGRPFYRIIAADSRRARDGKALEFLGFYNPLSKELKFDREKLNNWISKGAQLTETVKRLVKVKAETV